jgi:hypothetical protein
VKDIIVKPSSYEAVHDFVKEHHYSKSTQGITGSFYFEVQYQGELAGAAIFGFPVARQTLDKYSDKGRYYLLELRRLVLKNTPEHTAGHVLTTCFKFLKGRGVQRILSYADPNVKNPKTGKSHEGIVYRATGFKCQGRTAKKTYVLYNGPTTDRLIHGRRYAIRNIDQYKKNGSGELYPYAEELRKALATGAATRIQEPGKFIYLKYLVGGSYAWVLRVVRKMIGAK